MKKTVFLLMASAGMLLSSCTMGSGENSRTVGYTTCNMITPLNGGEPTLSYGSYVFSFDFNAGTAGVSTNTLMIDNKAYSFSTDPVKYTDYGYRQVIQGLTGLVNNGNMEIKDATFMTAIPEIPENFNPTRIFTPTEKNDKGVVSYLPGTIYAPNVSSVGLMVVANYTMGNEYQVKTFTSDVFYTGDTSTSYQVDGASQVNQTKSIVYRIIMDIEKKKAALVMYNAKFSNSPQEPEKAAIYVPGLDVNFTGNGYEITGTDIVPYMYEGSLTMPDPDLYTKYENYKFDSFRLSTTDKWLSSVMITYKVGGVYNGSFAGKYVTIPDGMK